MEKRTLKTEKRTSMMDYGFSSVLFFVVIVSFFSLSSSQSNPPPPRNIETFYPFTYLPPPPPPDQSASPNYIPQPPSSSGTSKKAIMTAVGATAASAFVVAAAFFLLFTWFSRRRKKNGNGESNRTPPLPPAVAASGSRSEYKKIGGNVRGYIIDEDGLDMLYWKKLSNSGGGFKKEPYNTANGKRPPAVPRGRSSSSHAQIHPRQGSGGGGGGGEVEQPVMSTIAVPKAGPPAVPPPPPPIPGKKNQTPPPPPPSSKPPAVPPIKTVEAVADNDQVKLKPLHWEKLKINPDQPMVWDKIEKGSFQYNGDMMEALFGVVATNRRSPKQSNSTAETSKSNPQIFILDPRKSQNIAIVIKSLGISLDGLIYALLQGKGLTADTLEKLTRAALTTEEASQILSFNGDPTNLADAESFLYVLLKAVPSAFARVDEMLFRLNYDSEISFLKESLRTLDLACNELRSRGIFLKLLEAILKAGNRLNAGTSRGDAKAFNLTTLTKLSDYKSSDGKTTLLHFVVHEVVRNEGRRCVLARSNSIGRSSASSSDEVSIPKSKDEREKEFLKLGLPVVGGLSSEFSNVNKAASTDYDTFTATIASLVTKVGEAREMVGDGSGGFFTETREFCEAAEVEIKEVGEEHTRVMKLVNKTTQYYQAGASNEKTPLQLFVIVRNFLGMVDQTCVEIARSSQQKKQATEAGAASGSGSGASQPDVLRSRVTFPRLPDHFLSDKSGSGSDEDS